MAISIDPTMATKSGIRIVEKDGVFEAYNTLNELKYRLIPPAQPGGIMKQFWFGYLLDEEIVDVLNILMLPNLAEHKVSRFLNDTSKLEGSWDGLNDWLATDFMPKAIGAGLCKLAFVISPDIFGQMSAENFDENTKSFSEFENRMFGTSEDAMAWLESTIAA